MINLDMVYCIDVLPATSMTMAVCCLIACTLVVPAEVLDFGYPQNCALEVLQSYINFGSVKVM